MYQTNDWNGAGRTFEQAVKSIYRLKMKVLPEATHNQEENMSGDQKTIKNVAMGRLLRNIALILIAVIVFSCFPNLVSGECSHGHDHDHDHHHHHHHHDHEHVVEPASFKWSREANEVHSHHEHEHAHHEHLHQHQHGHEHQHEHQHHKKESVKKPAAAAGKRQTTIFN